MVTVAVDCMGGDFAPKTTLPACRRFLRAYPNAKALLVGKPEAFLGWKPHTRASIIHAQEVVEMDDTVETALRRKKVSSMRLAIEQVKKGVADVAVSAGNTGALMAIARYLLRTLDNIDRPAIATEMPNRQGKTTIILDLGANVDCEPHHLLQFAWMGSALAASLKQKNTPSVGLLNIGAEAMKGGETIQKAGELLKQSAQTADKWSFYGNVEGDDIFKGAVDVVVCDGFVGNVALKTIEGLASMFSLFLREEFTRNPFRKASALLASSALRAFKKRADHRHYNGAALLGLQGLVFKSHGSADEFAFYRALARAYEAAESGLLQQIKRSNMNMISQSRE
jgi:glycerol-3-phosphate acyltransferase PlsX